MFAALKFFFLLLCFSYGLDKLNVTLYYESFCPDCKRFITEQLYPAYESLEEYLEVELIPYGFATVNDFYYF